MFKLSKKALAAILILAGLGFGQGLIISYYLFPGRPDLPPPAAISRALKATAQARSYEYMIKMSALIDGKEETTSQVKGERQDQRRVHLQGRILDAGVDFYQLDTITYTKDQLTGEWVKITDDQVNQQEIFKEELNPLASFAYKELREVKYAGINKLNGRKYWVFTACPVVQNPYLEMFWQDFRSVFWVEPRSFRIYRAHLTAAGKNKPADKLNLLVEFTNYDGKIELKPPI